MLTNSEPRPLGISWQNTAARLLLFVWISLWGWFVYHSWFLKEKKENNLSVKYTHILQAGSLEDRQKAVIGPAVYGFIQFAREHLSPTGTYQIEGMDRGSLDFVRTVYFLYPRRFVLESPESILVYGGQDQYSLKRGGHAGVD